VISGGDKTLLWDGLNIQKVEIVCQENRPQDMLAFFRGVLLKKKSPNWTASVRSNFDFHRIREENVKGLMPFTYSHSGNPPNTDSNPEVIQSSNPFWYFSALARTVLTYGSRALLSRFVGPPL